MLNTWFVSTPCSYSHLHFFSLKHLWQKICIILCKKAINMLIKDFYVYILILIATLLNFKWMLKYSWYEAGHKIISIGYFIPFVFIILIKWYIYLIFYIRIYFTLSEFFEFNHFCSKSWKDIVLMIQSSSKHIYNLLFGALKYQSTHSPHTLHFECTLGWTHSTGIFMYHVT